MSVLEKNSIDYIYVEDNHIIMGISDHLTWQEEAIVAHWQLLQDKLKNYIGFIKSGQLFEQYPEFDKQPCIKIFFSKKLIGTLITNTIAPPSINGNIICPIVFSTSSTTSNFHRATTRSAVNTISSRIFLIDKLLKSNIFLLLLPYMYSLNFSG